FSVPVPRIIDVLRLLAVQFVALPLFHLLLFSHHPAPTVIQALSLHDALPISFAKERIGVLIQTGRLLKKYHLYRLPELMEVAARSEEHTSELQSRFDLVCRLLLEKKISKDKTSS